MTTTQKFLLGIVAIIAILGVGLAAYKDPGAAQPQSGLGTGANSYGSFTNSQVAVSGATSTQVLAVNTNRAWAQVQNIGTTTVYCAMQSTAVTTGNAGVLLDAQGLASSTANSRFVVPFNIGAIYPGAVNCIANGVTSTVMVLER